MTGAVCEGGSRLSRREHVCCHCGGTASRAPGAHTRSSFNPRGRGRPLTGQSRGDVTTITCAALCAACPRPLRLLQSPASAAGDGRSSDPSPCQSRSVPVETPERASRAQAHGWSGRGHRPGPTSHLTGTSAGSGNAVPAGLRAGSEATRWLAGWVSLCGTVCIRDVTARTMTGRERLQPKGGSQQPPWPHRLALPFTAASMSLRENDLV